MFMDELHSIFYFSLYLLLFVSVCDTLEITILNLLIRCRNFYSTGSLLLNMLSYNLSELTESYEQLAQEFLS